MEITKEIFVTNIEENKLVLKSNQSKISLPIILRISKKILV